MKQGKWHYGPELYESADRPDFDYRYRDGLYAADLLTAALAHPDFFTWLNKNPSDLDTICRSLGLQERPTDVMLASLGGALGCCSLV